MADLLNIGLSALLAQQRALSVTANNIANASTPGYTRQRAELAERPSERLGAHFVGTGVAVGDVRRLGDELMAMQLRTASSSFHRADIFAGLAEAVGNLLADEQTGLNATLQSFVNALQNVANDPSSIAARQTFLSEARSLSARFDGLDARLSELETEVGSRLGAVTTEINSIGASIADINEQLLASGAAAGHGAPPELLDQRDGLLERLSELVDVSTTTQQDGTLSVFIGSGQALVLGTESAELAAAPGRFDPREPDIVLNGPGGAITITHFLSGGELGALLDFRREMLEPTRAALGRVAYGLADAVNSQHRAGMDLRGALGGDFFAVPPPSVAGATTNVGTASAAVTIADVGELQPASYRLHFDGADYRLFRADSGAEVTLTGSGTALDPLAAEGLEIVMSGAPAAGDEFLIRPLERVAGGLDVLVTNPDRIAAAAPVRTAAALSNAGDGAIGAATVTDATDPNLLTPTTIEFLDAATYSVNGGPPAAYVPGAAITVNGASFSITGAPAAGDTFTLASNAGGVGDNRNMLALAARLDGGMLDGGSSTLQGAIGRLVTEVGSMTAESQNVRDAQERMLEQSRQRLDAVRGVNLDEEAADMLRAEQMYQAAAQTIAVADSLFNSLLAALRR